MLPILIELVSKMDSRKFFRCAVVGFIFVALEGCSSSSSAGSSGTSTGLMSIGATSNGKSGASSSGSVGEVAAPSTSSLIPSGSPTNPMSAVSQPSVSALAPASTVGIPGPATPTGSAPKISAPPVVTGNSVNAGTTPRTVPTSSSPASDAPAQAKDVGYSVRTFGPDVVLSAAESSSRTRAPFFVWDFWGESVPSRSIVQNSDGSVTLLGGGPANAQIASVSSSSNKAKFAGTAFGGGAYFEATIKFDGWNLPVFKPVTLDAGFPAFWAMAVEHLTGVGDQWPSEQAGFKNFVEYDFFEYNSAYSQGVSTVYSGSIHDWYGMWRTTCPKLPKGFCDVENNVDSKLRKVPLSTNFSDYHKYGALWVPATPNSDGYMQWFFDGAAIGHKLTWSKWTNSLGAIVSEAKAFGIGDAQHVALILGTGRAYKMTIGNVSVWQATTSKNLSY
jgi:hypothetical protein